MNVSEAAKLWLEYHKCHSKENSIRAYKLVLTKFWEDFEAENLEGITTEMALSFLNRITEGKKQLTKKLDTPIYRLFSISSKQHRPKLPKSVRYAHVEKAFQSQTFL